jgi:hypothetical protein
MGTWLEGKVTQKDLEDDPRLAYGWGYKPKRKASGKKIAQKESMRLFLDTNVLFDLFGTSRPFHIDSLGLVAQGIAGNVELVVTLFFGNDLGLFAGQIQTAPKGAGGTSESTLTLYGHSAHQRNGTPCRIEQ